MKLSTSILVGLVLATPACAVTEADMADATQDALSARIALNAKTFLSKDTFVIQHYEQVSPGEWAPVDVTVRYRLRFIAAHSDTYSWDGEGSMESEAILEAVSVAQPEKTFPVDVTYYAKRTGSGTFRLYDCDSTSRCTVDGPVSSISFRNAGGAKELVLSQLNDGAKTSTSGIYLEGNTKTELVFAPAAPTL